MKWLAAVLALLAGAVLTTKWWMGQRADGLAQAAETYLADWGSLSWGETFADFTGAAGLDRAGFERRGPRPLEIFADRVTVYADVATLLGLAGDALPDDLLVEIESDEQFDWSRVLPWLPREAANVSGNPFETAACGGAGAYSRSDLGRMGYPPVPSRAVARYEYDASAGLIEFRLEFMTRRVSTVLIELYGRVDDLTSAVQRKDPRAFQISRLRVTLDDQEFNTRRNQLCAQRRGRFSDPFLLEHVQAVGARLGFDDASVLAIYSSWAAGGLALELEWRAPSPVGLDALLAPDAAASLDRDFELTVSVEGGPPRSVSPIARALRDGFTRDEAASTQVNALADFTPLAVDALSDALDQEVMIVTRTGQQYRGRLVAVDLGHVMIQVETGDTVEMLPLRLDDIERASRRRKETE